MIPIGGLTLACIAALAWAGLDAFRKHLSATIAPAPLLVLLNGALLPVFAAWLFVAGGTITNLQAYALPSGIAVVLQVAANGLFLAAVRVSPLSLTIPFLALTPVFAAAVGALVLGERPEPLQLTGIALVVLGALTLGSDGPAGSDDDPPRGGLLQVFVREPGAWMMVGVAACWGVTSGLDKAALAHASVPIHALIQLAGVVLAGLLYLALRGRLGELAIGRRGLAPLGLATLTGAVALGAQLVAVQLVLVSVLETIKRALGLVSAVALGWLVFAEPVGARKLLAVAVMAVGVILLTL